MIRRIVFALLLAAAFALPALAARTTVAASYGVRMENAWIPMKDGVRLSATLYMPDGAKPGEKFPAILEYQPYRKDDAMAARDYEVYTYFAHRGYVCARVDIRGFGTSEGSSHRPRIFRTRADGRFAGDFLARSAVVVERQRRDDGHFLERIQFAADGYASSSGAESDSCCRCHRGIVS